MWHLQKKGKCLSDWRSPCGVIAQSVTKVMSAVSVSSSKVRDGKYINWLKVTLALFHLKNGIHSFVDSEVKRMHEKLIWNIYRGCYPLKCTNCDSQMISWNGSNWEFHSRCYLGCSKWLQELQKLFKRPIDPEQICWTNSCVPEWLFSPWECAKIFLPRGQLRSNTGPCESDSQALMTLLSNCQHFRKQLSQTSLRLTSDIKKIRNNVMHSAAMEVLDADRSTYIKQIISFLQDPVFQTFEECKTAVANVQKIDNSSLDVFFDLGTEVKALSTAINEIRLQLGMEVKKNWGTIESLKEEYKELRELLLKRQEDFEKELKLHGTKIDTIESNISTKLQELGNTVTTIQQQISVFMETISARKASYEENVQNCGRKRKAAEDNGTSEIPTKRRPESDGLRQLKNQTENNLDIFRTMGFIPTKQTEEAKKLLQEKRSVVIKGNPGEGKTSTALHLIDNDDYRDQRVVVKSPEDWKKVDTDSVKVVVMEDIFGRYDLDPGRLQEWIDDYLQTIENHVYVGKFHLIITIRDDILSKAYSKLKSFKLFLSDISLTLSSEKLTSSDKMSILNGELERNNKDMNVHEKDQCIANFSGLIGFPQCCSLFAGDKDLFGQGPNYFKSPYTFLVNNIRNLKANSFLSLAFLFCNGEIEEKNLSPSEIKKSKKYLPVLGELASYLNISFNESVVTSLIQSYYYYSGLYVKRKYLYEYHSGMNVRKSWITFSHDTVYEAVGQVIGDRFPEMVVKYGDSRYLYQRTFTVEAKDSTSQNVFIPVCLYGLLAERMVHDVVEKGLVQSLVKHSAFKQNQFLMKLKEELYRGNRIRDFFMANPRSESIHQNLAEGECNTFLQKIFQNDEDVVKLVYSHFMEVLACTHNNMISDCWQCKEKQSLLELALYYHHFEIADKLITMNACYTHVSLCNAARHNDLSRVQTVLECIKRTPFFNPECIAAKKSLCRAYISGNQYVIEILLQEGITLDTKHVIAVALHGDINALIKVVEHLKCQNKWHPQWEENKEVFHSPSMYANELGGEFNSDLIKMPCSIALHITYCNEKFEMADYLLNNKVKMSLKMLAYVSKCCSQQAVARVIH